MFAGVVEAIISAIMIEIVFEVWDNREKIQAFLEARRAPQKSLPPSGPVESVEPVEIVDEMPLPEAEAPAPPPPQPQMTPAAEDAAPEVRQLKLYKTILRIGASMLIGFIIGGLVAGVVEYEAGSEVALGSGLSLLLIGVPTLLVWFAMYYFGPLKNEA